MDSYFDKKYYNVTRSDLIYAATNLIDVQTVTKHKKTAYKETARRFGNVNHHNNDADAFRHCFWSALLARDLGYSEAKRVTDGHEDFLTNNPKEKKMDLANNAVGLSIGQSAGPGDLDSMLANRCYAALEAGRLAKYQ